MSAQTDNLQAVAHPLDIRRPIASRQGGLADKDVIRRQIALASTAEPIPNLLKVARSPLGIERPIFPLVFTDGPAATWITKESSCGWALLKFTLISAGTPGAILPANQTGGMLLLPVFRLISWRPSWARAGRRTSQLLVWSPGVIR
jgi:hypothetical protein